MNISVLYVEDNLSDVELFRHLVEAVNPRLKVHYINTLEEVREQLEKPVVDVVVSDFNLKSFTGLDVLEVVKSVQPPIPVIFFTASIGEEKAAELIRAGATDFVLKANIEKISLTIERAYEEQELVREKDRIQKKLSEQNHLMDTLLNNLTDMICQTGPQGKINKVNNSFIRFHNTTENAALSKKEEDYLTDEIFRTANRKILENREPYSFETTYADPNGNRIILEVIKSPILDQGAPRGIVTVMRDITERRRLEEQKLKDQQLLKQAELQTRSGSFEYDPDSDILSVSPNLMRLLNLRGGMNNLSFKRLKQFIHHEDRGMFVEKFENVLVMHSEFAMEHRYKPQLHEEYRFCKTVLKTYHYNQDLFFYGTIQDTTESRRASMAMLNLQEAEHSRISRELHDNVGQKMSAASMLLDAGQGDHKKVKSLVDSSIEDIRNISKLLSTPVLSDRCLQESLRFLIDTMPHSEIIELQEADYEHTLPEFVKKQLYRITQEALNNALKYSQASKINVCIASGQNTLTLQIKDNGKGFDPHRQKQGNGLRNMTERVKNCSGLLQIDSAPDHGTEILIKIPIENDSNTTDR